MKTYYVYIICHEENGNFYSPIKIGISDNPDRRLASLSSGNPKNLAVFHRFGVPDKAHAASLEKDFMEHPSNKAKRMKGEWFDITPDAAFISMMMNIASFLLYQGLDYDDIDMCTKFSAYECGSGNGRDDFPSVRLLDAQS